MRHMGVFCLLVRRLSRPAQERSNISVSLDVYTSHLCLNRRPVSMIHLPVFLVLQDKSTEQSPVETQKYFQKIIHLWDLSCAAVKSTVSGHFMEYATSHQKSPTPGGRHSPFCYDCSDRWCPISNALSPDNPHAVAFVNETSSCYKRPCCQQQKMCHCHL